MANFENYFILIMAAAALIDRFIFRRKSVFITAIGKAVVKESALAFPVSLSVKRSWISDAQIEYWLQDLKNLTNGNCRLNPFYRIFPINDVIVRQFTITNKGKGGWNVK